MTSEQSPKRLQLATLTLDDCLLLYEQDLRASSPDQAESTLAQLSTALGRFTLPGWGFPPFQGDPPDESRAERRAAI